MRIKVYAPAFLNFEHIDENGYIELEEGKTLNDVYKKLKIPLPFRMAFFSAVNYKKVKLGKKLKDGDVVSFISLPSGG